MVEPSLGNHIGALRRYARVLLGDHVEAEDLVQECLTRALSRAHLWQPGTDLRAWLFTILHNLHVNAVRSRQVHVAAESMLMRQAQSCLAARPVQDARLELRDLDRALQRIPDEQRQVLLLIGMEGMSYDEAAAILGAPVGTVMSRVARGRESLRRHMMPSEIMATRATRRGHLRQVK